MITKIKVALVDDNQEFLISMIRYLSQSKDILVVGTATTKEQALKLPEIYDLDIIVIDLMLNENHCDGLYVINQILATYSQKPKVIILTNNNDEDLVRKSFLAGAVYYMLKTNYKALSDIIIHISNNEFPMESIFRDYVDLMKDKILRSKFQLSEAEILIYKLVEMGKSQSHIVKELYISESTYKKHINHILKKINSSNIKQAINKFYSSLL